VFATPGLTCGVTSGTYNLVARDNGIDIDSSVNHVQIVAGLQPSTTYYCQVSSTAGGSTVTSTFSIATTATPANIPATGVSYSTPIDYNTISPPCVANADTMYNAESNDGLTYFLLDDTNGWFCDGTALSGSKSGNMTIGVWTSISPLQGHTLNWMTAFGAATTASTYNSRSSKNSGLLAMDGKLFMWNGGQQNWCCGLPSSAPAFLQDGGNLLMSGDHGRTWNNFQKVGTYLQNGKPITAAMFSTSSPTTMGSCTFVMYDKDDGTLGYFSAVNRHDQADAFVYLHCNDGYWNNGNALYLVRVLRAKIQNLNPADYQWYIGGDGSQDSAWSNSMTSAQAIISATGQIGEPASNYVTSLNTYLVTTFYYPNGLAQSNPQQGDVTWVTYNCTHVWGPCNVINTTNWPTQGYYNPVPIHPTILSGLTPTVLFTSGFSTGFSYHPYLSTMTIQH
jgi:hypothetical protein